MEFLKGSFDVGLSSLALHYVSDYDAVVQKVYDLLTGNEHPIYTANGLQDWYYNEEGEILHFPVDNDIYEGIRISDFLGEKVIKCHRPLITYLSTLQTYGFKLEQIVEPKPPFNKKNNQVRYRAVYFTVLDEMVSFVENMK